MLDAIVIGAGPAGSRAALEIAKEGCKVLLLEKKKKVGFPNHCGEGLSRFAIENNGLSVEEDWVKKKVKGVRIIVPNKKRFFMKGDGFSIDREKFDSYVAKKAQESGAEIKIHTNVLDLKQKDGYFKVYTNKGNFEAKILIGADGPQSTVAKKIGLISVKERIKGVQYKFKDIDYEQEEWLDFYYAEKYEEGYIWAFPRGDEYNIGICGLGKIKSQLDDFCKGIGIDPKKRFDTNAGMIPRGGSIPCFVKENALICGDAAGLTNPVTKGGVHAALYSGRIAGEFAAKALKEDDFSILSEYETTLRNSPFCNKILMKYGSLIYSLEDEVSNFLGDLLEGREYDDVPWGKAILMVLKKPSRLRFFSRLCKIKRALKYCKKYGW